MIGLYGIVHAHTGGRCKLPRDELAQHMPLDAAGSLGGDQVQPVPRDANKLQQPSRRIGQSRCAASNGRFERQRVRQVGERIRTTHPASELDREHWVSRALLRDPR